MRWNWNCLSWRGIWCQMIVMLMMLPAAGFSGFGQSVNRLYIVRLISWFRFKWCSKYAQFPLFTFHVLKRLSKCLREFYTLSRKFITQSRLVGNSVVLDLSCCTLHSFEFASDVWTFESRKLKENWFGPWGLRFNSVSGAWTGAVQDSWNLGVFSRTSPRFRQFWKKPL